MNEGVRGRVVEKQKAQKNKKREENESANGLRMTTKPKQLKSIGSALPNTPFKLCVVI
jgi:hypothetical protein